MGRLAFPPKNSTSSLGLMSVRGHLRSFSHQISPVKFSVFTRERDTQTTTTTNRQPTDNDKPKPWPYPSLFGPIAIHDANDIPHHTVDACLHMTHWVSRIVPQNPPVITTSQSVIDTSCVCERRTNWPTTHSFTP